LTPKAQFIKGKTDQLNFIKIKNFCSAKLLGEDENIKLQSGRKYLQTTYSVKDFYLKLYTENSQ